MSGAPSEAEVMRGMRAAVAGGKTEGGSANGAAGQPEPAPANAKELRSLIDRLARLEEEKKELSGAIRDVYTEADGKGYGKKALRALVKREMETADQRSAREQTERDVEAMLAALGDFASSPLGDAAIRHARQ